MSVYTRRTREHQADFERLLDLTTPMLYDPMKLVFVLDRALGLLSHEDLLLALQEAERQAHKEV